MKKGFKLASAGLALMVGLCSAGCSGGGSRTLYDGDILQVTSSDSSFDSFYNELTRRNLRYDDYAIGSISIPEGISFNMGWQTAGLVWHNANALDGSDKISEIYSKFLQNRTQDDYGYVYDADMHRENKKDVNSWGGFPQGWTFPNWKLSLDDLINGKKKDMYIRSFEFDKDGDEDDTSSNWTAENGSFDTSDSRKTGCAGFASSETIDAGESLKFYKDDLASLMSAHGGMNGYHAAFVEIDMDFKSENLEDIYLIWKTTEGGDDVWYSAAAKDYVTIYNDQYSTYGARTYWPMYLNENWNGKTITAIGLEFKPEQGKTLSVSDGSLTYIRPEYDTRQHQFTTAYIESFYNYVLYTRDIEVLRQTMPKARKALLFFTHCLQGENGLIDVGFFNGHNGIGITMDEEGNVTSVNTGNGLGSSYWDILAEPEINLNANVAFYKNLGYMATLEKICEANDIEVEDVSIKNRVIGEDPVEYDYTSESLTALMAKVKENVSKEINPVKQADGSYKNEGGLWNSATGRFALGIREDTGAVADQGYVYFNEEAICAGLGTDEQRLSIMQWINGDRTVESDLSKGDDIYFYEFAPRFSTCDTSGQFGWAIIKGYILSDDSPKEVYGTLFSRQVQSGGAVLCWSYYDVLARAQVLGADNAYERLKEIQAWYEKVKAAGGEGDAFFDAYYNKLDAGRNGDMVYSVQGSSTGKGAGALGLDSEFLENILFSRALADAIFGMNVKEFDLLSFTNYGAGPSEIELCNLKYGSAVYNVLLQENSISVSSVKGAVNVNTKVELRIKATGESFKVYVDGQETTDYTVNDGYVSVTVGLKKVKVEIK